MFITRLINLNQIDTTDFGPIIVDGCRRIERLDKKSVFLYPMKIKNFMSMKNIVRIDFSQGKNQNKPIEMLLFS